MYNYKLAFWILFIAYPVAMTFYEIYAWKRGFKKGCEIGALEERTKNQKRS